MSSTVRPTQAVTDYFEVADSSGDPVTGLGNNDFTVEAALDGQAISIASEIGEVSAAERPGYYYIRFTAPATVGSLLVVVRNTLYFPRGLSEQYFVAPSGSAESGAQLVQITVTDGENPISGVLVNIYDSTETVKVLGNLLTDTVGQLSVALDNGSYKVLLSKQLIDFGTTKDLVVSGATSVEYEGTPPTIYAPTSDDHCVLYGFLGDIFTSQVRNAELSFELFGTNLFTFGGRMLDRTKKIIRTDGNGRFSVEVYRSSAIDPEYSNRPEPRYKITLMTTGDSRLFQLPDVETLNIADATFDNDGTDEWQV